MPNSHPFCFSQVLLLSKVGYILCVMFNHRRHSPEICGSRHNYKLFVYRNVVTNSDDTILFFTESIVIFYAFHLVEGTGDKVQ